MSAKKVLVAIILITFFTDFNCLLARLGFFQNFAIKSSNFIVSNLNAYEFIFFTHNRVDTRVDTKLSNPYVNVISLDTDEDVDFKYSYNKAKNEKVDTLNVKTLLDDVSVNSIDPLTKDELIKKEIQKLNQELDGLNEKLRSLSKENKQLKEEIEKYNNEDKFKVEQKVLIENLKKEARTYKISLDLSYLPNKYISALDLLIIGDIDLAQKQFIDFINTQPKNKKSREYLNSTSSSQINSFIASAYYWLGRINNINRNYKNAVENFSLAYKYTDFSSLSLISLVGLIDSFTSLSQSAEACTAVKQFMQDYQKASSNKNFVLDQYYLKLVENFKIINKCQ